LQGSRPGSRAGTSQLGSARCKNELEEEARLVRGSRAEPSRSELEPAREPRANFPALPCAQLVSCHSVPPRRQHTALRAPLSRRYTSSSTYLVVVLARCRLRTRAGALRSLGHYRCESSPSSKARSLVTARPAHAKSR
jgi:hypothetical protein